MKQAGEGLYLQQLEALAKMVPTGEEEAKLSSYNGDINELGSAEKFVKAILDIPFAFLRIEAMLYRETFEDEVIHLRKSFSMLEVTNHLPNTSMEAWVTIFKFIYQQDLNSIFFHE